MDQASALWLAATILRLWDPVDNAGTADSDAASYVHPITVPPPNRISTAQCSPSAARYSQSQGEACSTSAVTPLRGMFQAAAETVFSESPDAMAEGLQGLCSLADVACSSPDWYDHMHSMQSSHAELS